MESLEDWKQAAIAASNLSELELTLGEVAGAVGDAEQSVTYADRSGDAFMRQAMRCVIADALHQAGLSRRSQAKADHQFDAETHFREAEQMQAELQPEAPLLYSLRGFQHCELLLATSERAAWQTILSLNSQPLVALKSDEGGSTINSAVSDCRSVSQRVAAIQKRRTRIDSRQNVTGGEGR